MHKYIKIDIVFVRKIFSCFIFILLATIVWAGYTTESDSSVTKNQTKSLPSEITAHYLDSSTSNLDLNLPCQSSGTNYLRTNTTVKRPNIGSKNNFEFVKSGKVVNVRICNFIQKESLSNHFCFAKSSSWLITLGKLII